MKSLTLAAIAALLGSASASWYSYSNIMYFGTYSFIEMDEAINFVYETTYFAGDGPYYGGAIFADLDDTKHYEEYGFRTYLNGDVGVTINIEEYWQVGFWGNADIFTIHPYRQAIWFTKVLAEIVSGNTPAFHLWAGGSYDIEFGSLYISYTEAASGGYEDLMYQFFGLGGGWWYYVSASTG